MTIDLPERTHALRTLAASLESIGWSVAAVEIDLVTSTARVELRYGALVLTLDARNGRCTITRERVHTETVVVGRRGDRCPVERLRTEFLGRTRHEGIRSGLRWLCAYVADNTDPGALVSARNVRALFAPLLDTATTEAPP